MTFKIRADISRQKIQALQRKALDPIRSSGELPGSSHLVSRHHFLCWMPSSPRRRPLPLHERSIPGVPSIGGDHAPDFAGPSVGKSPSVFPTEHARPVTGGSAGGTYAQEDEASTLPTSRLTLDLGTVVRSW